MSLKNIEEIKNIANRFKFNDEVIGINRFGNGHINDTYKLTMQNNKNRSFLLQRINHHIFGNIEGLMNNIDLVTNHLKDEFKSLGLDESKHTLTIIPTHSNKLFYQDEEGSYWRVFLHLNNTKSYDIVETPQQAYSGGKAFGLFQKQLANLDAKKIVEILPNFHNIDFRLNTLGKAIEEDKSKRVKNVHDIITFIKNRQDGMRTIIKMAERDELPLRITHNDTKFNNVLLDERDQVQCVIDLDTVMPGYIAYDFGDAIRTIINPAAEDEKDITKIKLNIPLFKAYTEGYFSEAKEFLTEKEVESLWYGVLLLPYMQAVRFLTDYINGDQYYKTQYAEHNLVRTKTQIKLVEELEKHKDELQFILTSSLKNNLIDI